MNSEEILKNNIKESINKIKTKLDITEETIFDENRTHYINDFKKFYLENIEKIKNKYDWAIRREEYLDEYPLSKLNELKLGDYALGTDRYKESLSYKLEYGK